MDFVRRHILTLACGILFQPLAWSANISTNPTNFYGVNYDYTNVRFYSPTGESGVSADLVGSGLKIDFNGFASQSSGTNQVIDFSTGNLGLNMSSKLPSTIGRLDIKSDGTFYIAAPNYSTGSAGFNVTVPFNLTLTGVNGNPFLASPPTVGLSLKVDYTYSSTTAPYSASTYVDSPNPEFSSGSWTANWSGDVAALFPTVFTSPTMKVTEISLAITPNVTVWSQNGTASAYLTDIILQPIPEPSALSLLGFGGLALFFARRLRR